MVLGRAQELDADVVGQHRDVAHLLEHLLVALAVAADRAQCAALLERMVGRMNSANFMDFSLRRPQKPSAFAAMSSTTGREYVVRARRKSLLRPSEKSPTALVHMTAVLIM